MKNILFVSVLAAGLAAGCQNDNQATDNDQTKDVVKSEAEAVEEVAASEELCVGAGPQTPRDISSLTGLNTVTFSKAPSASEMNLCNIHTHTNAEHKGPGFSVFVDASDHGGYACNGTADLTEAELSPSEGAFKGVKSGQTIEVHWVHTSCDATPGEGLGACVPEGCTDPVLRVEAQTFLVVNDENALNFMDMTYSGNVVDGLHQAKSIPSDTGTPVNFLGSTTGPSYTQAKCSPAQVTWNVRPECAKLDINSLHAWAESGNVFNETKSHGVRQLVTAPELLSQIE
ncbi:delta-class carbonic anhydrase [Hirschia maritima]|uniref:delta-class carbonic anhydrase n=1 Tax=Hirschia maritima TaxID=1121961 RepID=UPI00038143E1|nr:delta-class carbonic anhydrase [Hirschia maritima]